MKINALLKTSNLWNEFISKFLNNNSLLISLSGKIFMINSWISSENNGFKNFINVKSKKIIIIERNKNLVLIIKSDDNKILIREFLELVCIKKYKINKKFINKKKNKFFLDLFLTKKYKENGKIVDSQ